ncbi:hypothetical protein WMY93_021541 [Mugilogobius chulae]|uniref:Uncharacterized protein n=1 Tax=Mugilogobius chulae TaxID=88201 RepID=A0AAW0NNF3_9GOBI
MFLHWSNALEKCNKLCSGQTTRSTRSTSNRNCAIDCVNGTSVGLYKCGPSFNGSGQEDLEMFRPSRQDTAPVPELNMVQLYCDAPHRHQLPLYKHPYLEHYRDLVDMSDIQLGARLEGVLRFEAPNIPETIHAQHWINEERPQALLKSTAMLLPFQTLEGKGSTL